MKRKQTSQSRLQTLGVIFRCIIAVVLVVVVTLGVGIHRIIAAISAAQIFPWIVGAFVVSTGLLFLGALGGWIMLSPFARIKFGSYLRNYIYSFSIGLVFPGQLGDASIMIFLKRRGISLVHSGMAYAVDKAMTFFVYLLVGWLGSFFLFSKIVQWQLLLIAPIVLGLVGIGTVAVLRNIPGKNKIITVVRAGANRFIEGVNLYLRRPALLVADFCVSGLKWVLVGMNFFLGFSAFLTVKWLDMAIIPIISTLVGYIPVSINGIGTVEYSAVSMLGTRGIPGEAVIAAYLVLRIIQYIIAGLFLLADQIVSLVQHWSNESHMVNKRKI